MTTEQEWAELKEAANRATPGPWSLSGCRCKMNRQVWHSIDRYIEAEKRDENIALVGYNPRTGLGLSDAKFIALANPATILALEAEHQRLREERKEALDYAFEATKAITNLTIGGSEFFSRRLSDGRFTADLAVCVSHIRDRLHRASTMAKEAHREAKASELARLRAENERLREALSRLLDWPNNFGGGERSDAVAFARAALAQAEGRDNG